MTQTPDWADVEAVRLTSLPDSFDVANAISTALRKTKADGMREAAKFADLPDPYLDFESVVAAALVEKLAIRCALGNNGGTWAEHYVEDQKNLWRRFVKDLFADVSGQAYRAGRVAGMREAADLFCKVYWEAENSVGSIRALADKIERDGS